MLDILDRVAFFLPSWMTISLALISGLAFYCLVYTKPARRNLPPGPSGLPFLGYFPFLGKETFVKFSKLAAKYGDVLSVNVFGTSVVFLNSYEAIHDCFVNKGKQFSGKPVDKSAFFWWIVDGLGIAQDEGPTWREHRRFVLHTLRDFGFGKLSLEARTHKVGGDLISKLESTRGQPYDPSAAIANCTVNMILYLTADKHFQTDDPDFILVRKCLRTVLTRMNALSVFLPTPLVKIIPLWLHPGQAALADVKKTLTGVMGRLIKDHEDTFDANYLRDYIDVYLNEKEAAEREGRKDSSFTISRLRGILLNLLVAGSETTSATLRWGLKVLIDRPEIQAKLHRELDEVVGRERLPSIMDKPSMPYTEAFFLELLRFSSIAPIGLPHSNPAPETLGGYNIPARSLVVTNIWAVHNDPRNWTQPEIFDPDRFLDPELKKERRERVVAFSKGMRSCLGESLARMEIFIFLTMMLQRFSFRTPDGDSNVLKAGTSFLRVLAPYKICVEERK